MRIKFVLKSEHVLASKGAWRPTPTQSTCLYYCDVMKLVSVINWSLLPVHLAGPPESSGFAASKRHTSSHTHTSLFKSGSDYLPSRLRLPVGAGRFLGESAGSGQVPGRCPPCTARSSALQASLQCYTDAVEAPSVFT